MGKLASHHKLALLTVVISQFLIIGSIVFNNHLLTLNADQNIVSVVAEAGDHQLLIKNERTCQVFDIPDNVSHLNYREGSIHLFDDNKQYLTSLQLGSQLSVWGSTAGQAIEYQDTGFECKTSTCLVRDSNQQIKPQIQVFSTFNLDYDFLDADCFKWEE